MVVVFYAMEGGGEFGQDGTCYIFWVDSSDERLIQIKLT